MAKSDKTENIPGVTRNFGSFTNAAGEHFTIKGLSPLLPQKIMEAVRGEFVRDGKALPVHPTYIVKTASEEEETHEHDETTLVIPGDAEQTRINQDTWAGYVRATAELESEYNVRLMRAVLMAVEASPTQAWREEMDFLGIPRPAENSSAEKYAYIETSVIQSVEDLTHMMTGVFRLAGVISEAAVAEVEATFRSDMETAFAQAGKSVNPK